jgi:hypothetical protein
MVRLVNKIRKVANCFEQNFCPIKCKKQIGSINMEIVDIKGEKLVENKARGK